MNWILRKSVFSIVSDSSLRARLYRGSLALLAALSFSLVPTCAKAACGSFGPAGINAEIQLPEAAQDAMDNDARYERPTIVGLWHVIYTNSADQSIFNNTLDTWHGDGTEFESAFLAPASGNVCAGVWKRTGFRSMTLHHVGWLFNADTPKATATNAFTLDEKVTVARDNKSYSGSFTFKVWNLDGSPTPIKVTGTMSATRITVN